MALRSNGDKRMQSIDSIEIYSYGTIKVLATEKEEIKCNNIIKRYKNVDITKENIKEHPWRQILVSRTSRRRSPPTFPVRPLKILFDHPDDVP